MTRRKVRDRDRDKAPKPVTFEDTGHELFDHAVRVCEAHRVPHERLSKDTLRLDRWGSPLGIFLAPSGEDRLRVWKSEGLAHRDVFLTTIENVTEYILNWGSSRS